MMRLPLTLAACAAAIPAFADAAPRLTAADVFIAIDSPTSCEVTLKLAVDGAAEIEHRIEAPDGSRVELLEVRDARPAGAVQTIGRTQSLVVRPDGSGYRLRYRVLQHAADRCPIWLPIAPADGRSRAVRIAVELPSGSGADDSMPAFQWTGARGETTIGHLPSIVRVAYGPADQRRAWSITRVMDALAIVVFAGASAAWTWRLRR
jgi:hypothetical protein